MSNDLTNRTHQKTGANINAVNDASLRHTFAKTFGHDRHVDAMIDRMVQNAIDMMPEEPAPDAKPVRRIGLRNSVGPV